MLRPPIVAATTLLHPLQVGEEQPVSATSVEVYLPGMQTAQVWLTDVCLKRGCPASVIASSVPAGLQLNELHLTWATLKPGVVWHCGSRLSAITLLELDRCAVAVSSSAPLLADMPCLEQLRVVQRDDGHGWPAIGYCGPATQLVLVGFQPKLPRAITGLVQLRILVGSGRTTTCGVCCVP